MNNIFTKHITLYSKCLRFNPCGPLAECYNKQPGFECGFCPAGYKTNHTKYFDEFDSEINPEDHCLDVNECEENTFDCPDTAICWNTEDNCQTKPNSGQEDIDNNGVGDTCDADYDKDGILNNEDNCPLTSNANQQNKDGDLAGDVCDNCPDNVNYDQEDIDNDQIGDACDSDADGDGVQNTTDNCPYKRNEDQSDKDGDGKGDVCDNCPLHYNPGQEDKDLNLIGDICDSISDADKDGIKDNIDNGIDIPNSDQSDLDKDGEGDACDDDIDNDGTLNIKDNCIMVYNPDQKVSNNNGRGDVCEKDIDGDGVIDEIDNCPKNNLVSRTDFRSFEQIQIYMRKDAYRIKSNGTEILRIGYSGSGNMILGSDRFVNVDYEGTIFVDTNTTGYIVGFVFGYQSQSRFYVVTWRGTVFQSWVVNGKGLQIMLIYSPTDLHTVLWNRKEIPNQSKLVYQDRNEYVWRLFTSYRWKLIHRPTLGLINLKIWSGVNVVVDTGYIFDMTLAGGKLGILAHDEPHVIFSNLEYRCDDYDPRNGDGST